ncbi:MULTISPECIES: nitric oxide reductase transcriptional regulator NorR [unclassified Vibrio]|uniref:Nitric oxide reductase transcriptional regulator NorR n=1 Tax=Vibrio sp. HB236076 TaxID=3232307 RepID=A0AB39HJX4_9VIBR|nr:nitric oxide reductase transcriptional regulator NorR [Vibrio sp. HB161653]MDP5253004.1 nitric oxide reductase transcriptional regulator NorR [Vibrio sp. HB161653]
MHDWLSVQLLHQPMTPIQRWQALVDHIQHHLPCSAVGLLKCEGDQLKPLAVAGLVTSTLGRRFILAEHPRLAQIFASDDLVHFDADSPLPDPYDGALHHDDNPALPVHDCMGITLSLQGKRWGVLTFDSLQPGQFDRACQQKVPTLARFCEVLLQQTELEQEVTALRNYHQKLTDVAPSAVASSAELIGADPKLQTLLRELDIVAKTQLSVLLTGETGVGKELFAQRLHQMSPRSSQAMVHINCSALPESLVESELFGHVKGAFSGALSERKGRVEAANQGTLFLDEVGELPLATQAKLLRLIQSGEIQRVGSDRVKQVSVRIVAATNRDLRAMVEQGQFRADLYHRLAVYPIDIPPLRERGQDVLLLAGYFIERNRSPLGFRSLRLSLASEAFLLAHPWPGNVRQLEHAISRACLKALTQGADTQQIVTLEPSHFGADEQAVANVSSAVLVSTELAVEAPASAEPEKSVLPLKQAVALVQRRSIEQALAECGGNWAGAAKLLDIDASNLHKLAKRLGLK